MTTGVDPYLGQRTLMRAFLDSILPPGMNPAPGEDMDNFLSALGDDAQAIHDAIALLAHVRDPYTTPYLDELEREYGITPNTQLSDTQRRNTLALVKFKRNRPSTISNLQDALNRAGLGVGGYGLQVFANDPAVNPATFSIGSFKTYLGGSNAYLGYFTGVGLPAGDWKALAFNGTTWCLVGNAGAATSTDGQNWTLQSIGSGSWSGICWTGTVWIAVSSDGQCKTGNAAGTSWTARTISSGAWNAITWTGTKAVAVGSGPTNYCATSDATGVTWTAQAGMPAGNWNGIAWSGALLCAVGNNVLSGTGAATSSDAITWNPQTIPSGDWRSVAYSSTLSRWVAVGASGSTPDGSSRWTGGAAYSSNGGVTWIRVIGNAASWNSVIWHPAGRFVELGIGAAGSSDDGISWTSRTIPSGAWQTAALNGSTLLAIAPNGNMLASTTDGLSWTATGASGAFLGQASGGGSWIVNGDVYQVMPVYQGIGGSEAYLGYTRSGSPGGNYLGEYYEISYGKVVISPPADPTTWPLVFFIAGGATRDGAGHIISMNIVNIPGNLWLTLVEIVMRFKPIHTWALAMVAIS
jgi:hypothetical protein